MSDLEKLPERWEVYARRKFHDAKAYPDGSMEHRFILHGAMCYMNAAIELRAALAVPEAGSSRTAPRGLDRTQPIRLDDVYGPHTFEPVCAVCDRPLEHRVHHT